MAYDVQKLVDKVKARGLGAAESAARGVLEDLLAWADEQAKLSASPFDDVVVLVLNQLKPDLMKAIDSIDGKVGG